MPRKGVNLDAMLQKSWGSLRSRLPLEHASVLDPRVAFEKIVMRNGRALITELQESREAAFFLYRLARGGSLTEDESTRLKSQLADMAKSIPALAIFALPGGAILLPVLAKLLPWDLLPTAFLRNSRDEEREEKSPAKNEKDSP